MKRALRTLLDRDGIESDMDAEMRHHLELETQALIESGLSPSEAKRQAAIAFGGVEQQKEQALDESGVAWLIHLRRDVRIALRALRRYPTFAITATLALSLAIAVNTSMFSIIDAMLNPQVGARDPENLYMIRYFGDPQRKVDFREARDAVIAGSRMFGKYAQFAQLADVVERGANVFQGPTAKASPNLFDVLEVRPIAGHLTPAADDAGIRGSVVISDRLAANLFARGESPVGSSITVGGVSRTVIGVVARHTALFGLDFDAWTFATADDDYNGVRVIRLINGASRAQADAKLTALAAQLAQAAGDSARDSRFMLQPTIRQFHIDRFHYALAGAGIAILLIACTNLANLQLARGLGRSSELAIRASLGASRRQIINQLIVESMILAVGALLLSLMLAIAGNAIVRATVPPSIGEYVVEPHGSWRMVVFAAFAATVCVIVVGLIPALRVSRVDLNSLLKSRAGTGAHKTNRRVYGALVIVQIAFTLPLLSAAILTTRAAARAGSLDYQIHEAFGYDPTPLITVPLRVAADTATPFPIAAVASDFIARAKSVSGVADAGLSEHVSATAITVDLPSGGTKVLPTPLWSYNMVTPSYFRTMGYPMEQGRDFTEGGHDEAGVIVDRESADYLWPGQTAVGRLIRFGDERSTAPFLRVQGVVGDRLSAEARDRRHGARLSRLGAVYRVMTLADSQPKSRYAGHFLMLTVRAKGEADPVLIPLQRVLRNGTLYPPRAMAQREYLGVRKTQETTAFVAGLFTTFGLLALGLSALGVYAIVAQSVADRNREVAVRMSLGATPKQLIHALLREGNVLVLAGVALGLFMAKETIGWLGIFLGEIDLTNAPLFGAICIALFAMMVGAALVPAIKATKLDPMNVLRAE